MQFTKEWLDSLRLEGDPLADKVIADMVATGQVEEVNLVLQHFQTNDQPIPEQLPELVREYLKVSEIPPAWADYERINRARDFFLDDGLYISAVLSVGSMVGCYAVPHGAKLLHCTHRLNQPRRRIAETGQFVFYMMDKNPLGEKSQFIPAIQKVRLVHAGVRHFLRQADEVWPEEKYGVPICQEDLLGALMLFSVQVLKGMKHLGVIVSQQEAEDYYYVWRVTGVMLGIREDIIPESIEDAYALNDVLIKRHFGVSEEGLELTRELMDMYKEIIPGKMFDGIAPALARYVVEDEIADLMEIPRSGWDKVVSGLAAVNKIFEKVEDHFTPARFILDKAAWMMLKGSLRVYTNGERLPYTIPADLQAGWEKRAVVDND